MGERKRIPDNGILFYWNRVKSVILVLISVIYIVINWINMCILYRISCFLNEIAHVTKIRVSFAVLFLC